MKKENEAGDDGAGIRARGSSPARRPRRLHAIRGATTVERDDAALILSATRGLLLEMVERNAITVDDIVSAVFTLTPDLHSQFPAIAARELGWTDVALLCTMEIPVPGALERTIRVMLHVEFEEPRSAVAHVYLGATASLRPDRSASVPNA